MNSKRKLFVFFLVLSSYLTLLFFSNLASQLKSQKPKEPNPNSLLRDYKTILKPSPSIFARKLKLRSKTKSIEPDQKLKEAKNIFQPSKTIVKPTQNPKEPSKTMITPTQNLKESKNIVEPSKTAVKPSQSILKQRAQNLKNLCSKKNLHQKHTFPNELFVLKERNLAYCAVPKAGTSTWMTYLLDLSAKPQSIKGEILNHFSHIGFKVGRQVAPKLSKNQWISWVNEIHGLNQSMIKTIVVRPPFERLVSAFRQKLEKLDPFIYKAHGQKIVAKYR